MSLYLFSWVVYDHPVIHIPSFLLSPFSFLLPWQMSPHLCSNSVAILFSLHVMGETLNSNVPKDFAYHLYNTSVG